MIRYTLRKERFGGLLFDHYSLDTTYVSEKNFNILAKRDDIRVVKNEFSGLSTLSAPTRIFLVLTKKCNLHCIHCSNSSGNNRSEHLSFSTVKSIVNQFFEMGGFEIGINGGEPLCHPQFFEIVDFIKRYGIPIHLNSNGIYSNEELNRLSLAGIERIKISLDGMQENHERIRGKNTFARTINSIKKLREAGNEVRINFTIARINSFDVLNVVKLANDLGCSLKIAPVVAVGRANMLEDIVLSTSEGQNLTARVQEYCNLENISITVEIDSSLAYSNCPEVIAKYHYQFSRCGNRRTHLSIDASGLAYSTGRQTHFSEEGPVGDIKTESLRKIWSTIGFRNDIHTDTCSICESKDVNQLLALAFSSEINME